MKRVVVTGASGFVGANVARRLLAEGHEVHLLMRPEYSRWRLEEIRGEVRFHECYFHDADAIERIMLDVKPEWVFHLAAHGAYSWQNDIHEMIRTNITGTVNLVENALNAGCEIFINTGSSSEYGFKDHAPGETELVKPNSYYAVTKASATMYCQHLAASRDARIHTLRLYSVYGAYEEPNRLMPKLIITGLNKELPVLANPDVARDYVYIDDVMDAYMQLAHKETQPGDIYNIGSGVETTLRLVVAVASETLEIKKEPTWGSMPNRSWDTDRWVCDNSKARQELDWEPKHSFSQGFRKMVDWFQENPRWTKHYSEAVSSAQVR